MSEQKQAQSLRTLYLLVILCMSVLAFLYANSSESAPRVQEWQVWQSRGSTTNYLLFKAPTAEEAIDKCLKATPLNASPSITYTCNAPKLVMVLTPATATCQTPNPATRTQQCPAGYTGTWAQSATVGSAPGCVVTWTPATPSAGVCNPIAVDPTGTATLTWTAPTQYTNGTPLTTLRNYKILYGTSPTAFDRTIETRAGTDNTYTIQGLAPGTYYFTVRSIDGGGNESVNSNVTSKVVR